MGDLDPTCQPVHVAELAKQERRMRALNCRLGDLAVTIRAELPENLGTIVRVVGIRGMKKWWGFKTPIFVWDVETVEGGRLVYEDANGRREFTNAGMVPDTFLKPIGPTWNSLAKPEECYVS